MRAFYQHVQDSGSGPEGAAPHGLVPSSTSDTATYFVDRALMRLHRMQTGVLTFARIMQEGLQWHGQRYRAAMFTLTYRPGVEWSARHISDYLKAVREYLRRRGYVFRYVWVMELTAKGVPHYHVLVWLPRGVTLPKPDKRGHWKHGSTRSEWARNVVGYIASYISKGEDGRPLPRGARLWGGGGMPCAITRGQFRWWRRPGFVRKAQPDISVHMARRRGGGWLDSSTGEILESGWRIHRIGPRGVHLIFTDRVEREPGPSWSELCELVESERRAGAAAMRRVYDEDRVEWLTLVDRGELAAVDPQCPF